MLKIYGADLSTPANKVRFTANYLGLEYDYIRIKIREGEHRRDDYLKINPAGKVPSIDDDGFILFESGAICKYLCDKHKSDLYPQDLKERALIEQWADFVAIHINGAMGRVVFNRLFATLAKADVDERSLKDGLNFLNRFLPVVDSQLKNHPYLAGNRLSLADITLLSTLDPAEMAGVDLAQYGQIVPWRTQLKNQEFYTRCYKEYGESLKTILNK